MSRMPLSSSNLPGKRFLFLTLFVALIAVGNTTFPPNSKVGGQGIAQACATCKPPSQQTIFTPLIELKEALSAEINLNCRSSHPIDAVPTFYTIEGTPVVGEAIHLLPAEMRFVNVQSLIPQEQRGRHDWGGMSLSYTGNTMEVWAQMTFHGVGKKGSVNSLFAVVDARRSNTQEAVWRMPKNATATLAMGNYSDTPAGATLTFSNGDVEQIILAPYAAKVISRKNNAQNSTGTDAESVRIEASGQIGRLITTGVIVSNNGKYASSLRFYDKENTFQPNLYSTNFRLKNSTPNIVLKNTTTNPITARPRFLPKTGEGSGVVELPAVTLPPNAVKELNLSSLISAAAARPELDSVAVQIINSGEKGSLIGAANFTDNMTGVDYDIPLRDSGASSRSAGGYPIRLDGDYSTILSLTNTGSAAGKFTLQINYAGGIYALYPQEVAPGATAFFDLRQIRDRQTPDSSGRMLPFDFTIGQIRWSQVGGTATTLIGRSEIVSKIDKVSSSYSCGICCRNSYQSSRLTPDQVFAFLGDESQLAAMQKDRDCYGNYFPEYAVTYPTWSSSDYSIVDVSYNGMATALDVGSAQLMATWETEYFLDSGSDTCDAYPVIAAPTGEMVVAPKITSISPSRGGVGSVARVTINGNFSTFTPTVSAGSGISVSIFSISSAQIVADFTIAANATGGNRNVTVSANGQTSNAVNFFVQIPTSLSVLSVTVIPTPTVADPLTSACSPGVDYGISVAIKYQVNDQNNPSSPIKNNIMVPQETVTYLYINGVRFISQESPDYDDLGPSNITGTSRTTDANGQFLDAPLGFCVDNPFTGSFVQDIRMLIDNTQNSYHVRTNNFAFASTTSGQGSVTNNSDIQKSRP